MQDLRQAVKANRDDAAEARYLRGNEQIRAGAVEAAKGALAMHESGHFVFRGCGSMVEYGERRHIPAGETMRQLALGRLLEARPDLEEKVLSGALSLHAASLMGDLPSSELSKKGGEWLGWATSEPARDFRRRVEKHLEDVRLGEATSIGLTIFVSPKGRDEFQRAKHVASKKAQRPLSKGETLEVISSHYLASFDPLRKKPGTRRMPDTQGLPGRNVPAEVAREVMGRRYGRCQVPFCPYEGFLHLAHLVPHARGGCRESRCLVWLCTKHHAMFDQGLLLIEGPAENPAFRDVEGNDLSKRVPAAVKADTGPPQSEPSTSRGRPPSETPPREGRPNEANGTAPT